MITIRVEMLDLIELWLMLLVWLLVRAWVMREKKGV